MDRKLILILILFFIIPVSCKKFLKVEPVGAVNETNFQDNGKDLNLLMTGLYSTLTSEDAFMATLADWAYGDVVGGNANKGSTFNDQSDFTSLEIYSFTTDNSYLEGKWQSVYDGVFRANNIISILNKNKDHFQSESGEEKDFYTEALAQARFFRGFWHFEGIRMFGAAIPYVGTEAFESSVNPNVSNVDESGNYIYIWDSVETDLKFAMDNLPETWTSDKGRINKWAAAGMLAKMLVYESSPYNGTNGNKDRWQDAKALLKDIIDHGEDNMGNKFRLADTYVSLFTAGESDWTGESVFDIQTAISGTELTTNTIYGDSHIGMPGGLGTGGWGFYQPSNEFVNSFATDANGLPMLDHSYWNLGAITRLVNNNPVTDLSIPMDPRLDINVGRFGVPYWDWSVPEHTDGWIRDVSNGGLYLNKKSIPKKADKGSLSVTTSTGSTVKNFHVIRFADIILYYAEALIETGNPQDARTYVNMVRKRASKSYVHAVDPNTMDPANSDFSFDNLVDHSIQKNAAGDYRIGLYPASQFDTPEKAMKALKFERKLEFGMEGTRWFDLARWGDIATELNNYVGFEKQFLSKFRNSVYNSKWVTFPIPHSEIITMEGTLVQNENWK